MKQCLALLFTIAFFAGSAGIACAKVITSSGGGISSSQVGAGYGSIARTSGSGHSATTELTLEQTATGAGSRFSKTETNSGSDSDSIATVAYSGTVAISGSVSGGAGTVTSRASLAAKADESPSEANPEQITVETKVYSSVEGEAQGRATVTGSARASGRATSSAQWRTDSSSGSLQSVSVGSTSAGLTLRDGSEGYASSEISGYSEGMTDGSGGSIAASLAARGGIEGKGSASSSASGTTTVSASATGSAGTSRETGYVDGKASGSLTGTAGGGEGEFVSGIATGRGLIGTIETEEGDFSRILAGAAFTAGNPAYTGSATADAKGTSRTGESLAGVTQGSSLSTYSNGQVSARLMQKGTGESDTMAEIAAGRGTVPPASRMLYPVKVAPGKGVSDRLTSVTLSGILNASSGLGSRASLNGTGTGTRFTASTSASGTATTLASEGSSLPGADDGEEAIVGTLLAYATGSTSSSLSKAGLGVSEAVTGIGTSLSLGPHGQDGGMLVENPGGSTPIDFSWETYGGTSSMVYSYSSSTGPSSQATAQASGTTYGTVDGTLSNKDGPDCAFSSTAYTSGMTSSKGATRGANSEAHASSVLFAVNSIVRKLAGDEESSPFGELLDAIVTQNGILAAAAGIDPDSGFTASQSTSRGNVTGRGTLEVYDPGMSSSDEKWTLSSRSSAGGTLTTDTTVKQGLGITQSWVKGGNFAGFEESSGNPQILSLDAPHWDAGIFTIANGTGLSRTGTINCSASAMGVVSDEEGHIVHSVGSPLTSSDGNRGWESDVSLDTRVFVQTMEKAEVKAKGESFGRAVSLVFAYSSAFFNVTGGIGGTDSWGGYGTMAAATNDTNAEVRSAIPGVYLTTWGEVDSTGRSPSEENRWRTKGRYVGGKSDTYLKAKPPEKAFGIISWRILSFEWEPDEPGEGIYRSVERDDTIDDPNYQLVWVSGHSSSHEHGEEYTYFDPEYYLGIPLPPLPTPTPTPTPSPGP